MSDELYLMSDGWYVMSYNWCVMGDEWLMKGDVWWLMSYDWWVALGGTIWRFNQWLNFAQKRFNSIFDSKENCPDSIQ